MSMNQPFRVPLPRAIQSAIPSTGGTRNLSMTRFFSTCPAEDAKKSGIAPNGTIPDFCLFSANDVCKRSYIKGLQVSSRFVNAQKIAHISLIAA
jgi:hypothetical protein